MVGNTLNDERSILEAGSHGRQTMPTGVQSGSASVLPWCPAKTLRAIVLGCLPVVACSEGLGDGDAGVIPDAEVARDASADASPDADDHSGPDASADAYADGSRDAATMDAAGVPCSARGDCAAPQVCHGDGVCGLPCTDDPDCTTRFGSDAYCNLPPPEMRPAPRSYKPSRDDFSCAPLGCEGQLDCPTLGTACDRTQSPPACVAGCYDNSACLGGEVCREGPPGSYSPQDCRALPASTGSVLGICCNPGCQDKVSDCGFSQWCCGEVDSPYEEPVTCLPPTATVTRQALPGECFDMSADPWCRSCGSNVECNTPASGWASGFIEDPPGSGQHVQQREFCAPIEAGLGLCTVNCAPRLVASLAPKECPRLWQCRPLALSCADCPGLPCLQGACLCGQTGTPTAACPASSCVENGTAGLPTMGQPGDAFCAAFNCLPPAVHRDPQTGATNYPPACGL